MNNLVRARNGRLFLHVNIDDLNSVVKSTVKADAGGGRTSVKTSSLATGIVSAVTKPFSISGGAGLEDTVSFNTSPVLDDARLYTLYLQFLNLKNGTQRLRTVNSADFNVDGHVYSIVTLEKGQKITDIHAVTGTVTTFEGKTYYIPEEFKQAYFDLCVGLIGGMLPLNPSNTSQSKKSSTNNTKDNRPPVIELRSNQKDPTQKLLENNEKKLNSLLSQ